MRITPGKTPQRPASRVVRGESSHSRAAGESRIRVILVAGFFSLSFLMLGVRLFEVSTVGSGDYPFKKLVTDPQLLLSREDDVDVSKIAQEEAPIRREVTDRNGMIIATSIKTASLVANPTIIRHEDEVAAGLHKIFPEESAASFREKLMRKRSTFLYLHRHLAPAQQQAVNNLGVPGLFFEPDMRRVYPYGPLFAHALGYVGVDNQGLSGIEKSFDEKLQDVQQSTVPLALSLDLRIQSMMREELARAVADFKALGATGIIMSIPDGEIIALSSLPDFDPHQPGKASDDARFNRATLGAYEMGSTFKTFTLAASLEAGSVTMKGGYNAAAPIHIGNFTISDAHPEGRWLAVPEIFAYSSNIGMAKMAMDLGPKRQREFLKSLGLFEPVAIEVPEVARPLVPREWPALTAMTVSYGHGISVSPLHLTRAIASVAEGRLLPVTLMKDGNKNKPAGPQVLSEENVKHMRDLLRLVVLHGTGKSAEVAGYEIGGKTGTAEKNSNGVYNKDAKVTSFVGVFPVSNPQYAILVMVDSPHGNAATHGFATGGWVSGPVVNRVVQRMAPLLAMRPKPSGNDANIEAMWADTWGGKEKAAVAQPAPVTPKGAVHAVSF